MRSLTDWHVIRVILVPRKGRCIVAYARTTVSDFVTTNRMVLYIVNSGIQALNLTPT